MADSIREALTKAYAEVEDETTDTNSTPDASSPATETEVVTTSAPEDSSSSEEAAKPVTGDGAPAETPEPAPKAQEISPPDPAPGSWKAGAKAMWDKIPAEARAEIKRREREISTALNHASSARKVASSLETVLAPHKELIEQAGVKDVIGEVIAPLIQYRAALARGTPEMKAMTLANIVADMGVDIGLLDNALTARMRNPGAFMAPPQPRFDPKSIPELAPLYALAERAEAINIQRAEEQIATVSALQHYEAVREDMADIIEKFAARGTILSAKQAYDRAVALNPELAPEQASAPMSVSQAASVLARQRRAASSVSGAPQTGTAKKPNTLRGQLEAAWDSHGG